ncbi:transglutaminase family protein [Opitutales bacterium ASA1]|nr:transglutaminase family protein [Opitutales bacterium ASA1]
MRFEIDHVTHYRYAAPASESFMEARLFPPTNRAQTVRSRTLEIKPSCRVTSYVDYYGNTVEQFAIAHRHDELALVARCEVDTHPPAVPAEALDITVSEARQIYRSQRLPLFDFLQPSTAVQFCRSVNQAANRLVRPGGNLGETLLAVMRWVYSHFTYTPGATDVHTTVEQALALRKGVCQDYAHAMIAVLRSAEIPARYVVGYIETERQRKAASRGERALVGAAESHAWVEAGLPNGDWYPLDPTNDILAGERHVVVATGRDFHDTSPTRGVFKGAGHTRLEARVHMRRVARD